MKTRIAAGATVLGLGGLTGLALSAGHNASAPVAAKPLVRTKVIRRTIHVTKHLKPKHPVGTSPGVVSSAGGAPSSTSVATGSSSVGSATSYEAPVTTSTSGASAAPGSSSEPVTTSTSGAGGGAGGSGEFESSGEHESEGVDD